MVANPFSHGWARAAMAAALVLGFVQAAGAQDPKDPWSVARDKVEPGQRVIFEASGAPRRTGLLQSISPEGLTVMVAGQATKVRREDVTRLWKQGDSKLNGFLIGAGGTAVVVGAGFADYCSDVSCDADKGAWVLAMVLYGGLGGLVGMGVDAMIDGKTLVYKRPAGVVIAPIVMPDRAGVQARLAW